MTYILLLTHPIFFVCLSCSLLSLVGACRSTECAHYAQCVVQRDGTALCVCPEFCSSSFRPVCGSNSRTYWNACFLRREACFMQQNTSVLSEKACSKLHIVSRLHIFSCDRFWMFTLKRKSRVPVPVSPPSPLV